MKNPTALVLFDIGGVLLKLNYSKLYKRGAQITGMSAEEFKKRYAALELGVMNGKISHEDYQKKLRQMLGAPIMARKGLEEFVGRCYEKELTEVVDLKEELYFNSNCLVGIFSNITQFSWEYLERKYPRMLQTFNPEAPVICSYLSGDVKPNLPAYRCAKNAAEKLGCKKIILIDDKISYLKVGAEQFGWSGIHFTQYIDSAEAIRSVAAPTETAKHSMHIRTANSVREIMLALRYFKIPQR